jgi:2-polyprenyl-3-methyl-5-hydroxy-6-metoxy-1,4-benzoquinol methylase
MDPAQIEQLGRQHGYRGAHIYVRHAAIARVINRLRPGKLLNVGSGLGLLEHRLAPDVVVHGFDPDPSAVAVANEIAMQSGRSFQYAAGDVRQATVTRQYDVVLCSEVLEHLPGNDDFGLLTLLRQWLLPDGHVVITVPNALQFRNRVRSLMGLGPVLMDRTHVREYRRPEIETLIRLAGYRVVAREQAVLYLPFERTLQRLIPPGGDLRKRVIRLAPDVASHFIYVLQDSPT